MKLRTRIAKVIELDDQIEELDRRLAAGKKKPQPIPARPAKQAQPRAAKKTSKRTRAEAEEHEEEEEEEEEEDEREEPVARRGPAEATTSGGRKPLGKPTLYVGERPDTHGWRPNAPDPEHPSSPVNFFFYLEEKGIRTDNAYILRNALAKSKYPHSILDFVKDPVYAFEWIDKHVSKKQSVYSKANVARAVTVALDHRLKWPPLASVDAPTRVKWNEELNRFDGDSFRYNEALSAKTLDLHLEDVRNLVRDYYNGKDEWERHGKWALLFYAYLFFAPFRNDWKASKVVQKREDCTNPKTNYLICPDLNDDSQNLSFFLQDSKTFGSTKKYEPRIFVIPRALTERNEWGQFADPGLVEFNHMFWVYLRTMNRNTAKQPPKGFIYGDYLFGKSSLGKPLKRLATKIGILKNDDGGFLNLNRKVTYVTLLFAMQMLTLIFTIALGELGRAIRPRSA